MFLMIEANYILFLQRLDLFRFNIFKIFNQSVFRVNI
jgi:hypothetical protein